MSDTKMPSRDEILAARDWLQAGAPAVRIRRPFSPEVGPEFAVRILLQLLEVLPERIPEYRWAPGELP